jgi:hypothetical protein
MKETSNNRDKPAEKQGASFPGLIKMTDGNIIKFVPIADVDRYKKIGYSEI